MKTAVLGYGVVGVGVWEMLERAEGLSQGKVLVRPGKEREAFMTSSLEELLSEPGLAAVVEVLGGVEPAYSYCAAALRAGKHVVSSNKALVAAEGPELAALARENGVAFLFSAACGGAIPFLHNLALARESDSILSLGGILNGTTNYILSKMQSEGADYSDALREAQALGYAELDPTADVSGLDSLRKVRLGAAVAWGKLPGSGCCLEGIESLRAEDVKDIRAMRRVCRLWGSASMQGEALVASVQPTLFPEGGLAASVSSNFNLAKYHGRNAGDIVQIGQGAGRYSTASAVLRDLSDILHGKRGMLAEPCVRVKADCSDYARAYYLRLPAALADRFAWMEKRADGAVVRGLTEPIGISEMHERAKELRENGAELFFAALEGGPL